MGWTTVVPIPLSITVAVIIAISLLPLFLSSSIPLITFLDPLLFRLPLFLSSLLPFHPSPFIFFLSFLLLFFFFLLLQLSPLPIFLLLDLRLQLQGLPHQFLHSRSIPLSLCAPCLGLRCVLLIGLFSFFCFFVRLLIPDIRPPYLPYSAQHIV